jgi:hypothetical protein
VSADDLETRPPTDAEHGLLSAVIDELVPARADRSLPAAGALGLAAAVDDGLRATPPLRAMVLAGLGELADAARARDPQGFAGLSPAARVEVLQQQGFVLPLALQVYAAYYSHPRVLQALGMEGRPPHPDGHAMPPDDFALLERVRRGPRRWRPV